MSRIKHTKKNEMVVLSVIFGAFFCVCILLYMFLPKPNKF